MSVPPLLIHRFQLATFAITCASGWERRAQAELKRALPRVTCRPLFMPGNLLLNTEMPRADALRVLDELDTTVVGRIVPLDLRVDIDQTRESFDLLLRAAVELQPLFPGASFRVACNRRGDHEFDSREVEHYVGLRLSDHWGLPADLELPDQVLCLEIFQSLAFVGMCWPEELLRKEIAQMHRQGPRPLNRAELKMREALQHFPLALAADMRALDLGAAPGGWTRVLAESCREVVAVDPAALDERIVALPNVVHVPLRADEFLAAAHGQFGLITCDMNLHPAEAAGLLGKAAHLLTPGTPALMTIKFQTRHRRHHVEEAIAILSDQYEGFDVQHLPHNGKETTLFMRRRAAEGR